MKKIGAILIAGLIAATAFAAPNANKNANKKLGKVTIIIVEDTQYKSGQEDPQLTQGVANFLKAEPKVVRLTPEQAAQDPKLSGIDYSFLPLYLVQKTKDVREKFAQPLQQGYLQETDDYVVLARQTRQGVYTKKKAQPGVMDLFVMAQCPYGVRAENLVIQARKNNQLPKGKELRIRYIVDYDATRGFNSMHGSGEWEEAVRQLLIAKYYPKQFWKYLEIRNRDYRSSRWDKAMEQADIDVKKITKKFDTEGIELLKAEAAYGKEFGIGASPTILWEGKVQMDLGTASTLDGFGFFNPSRAYGAEEVPAGSC